MIKKILLLSLMFLTINVTGAEPWIAANNLKIRADIQYLAGTGVINIPIATYPLMWTSIATAINNIEYDALTDPQKAALTNIESAMKNATQKNAKTRINLYASTHTRQFTSFGSNHFEKSKLSLSHEIISNNWAGKLQVNTRNGFNQFSGNKKTTYDGSYLAYKLGNWVVNYGMIDQWWGPGLDTSLIMSNNARPLPALSIRRNDSVAFESPWLSWIGPWTFTAQMAQLESERFVPDTKMWSTRATLKPFQKLELGLSWSYMWGGQGQPDSYSQFFRGLLGRTECANGASTCGDELKTKLGNQLAGFDLRWSDTILNQPYAFYAQTIGEDSPEPKTLRISDKSYLYGLETHVNFLEQRILINLEYSDTQANCGAQGDTSQDCFYEHGTYRSGYRYYQRSIGSTYDNDAETLTLTLFGQQTNGSNWQVKLKNLQLNTNDRDRFPNDSNLGNTVSKVAENIKQLDFQYSFNLFNGELTLGILLNNTKADLPNFPKSTGYINYQYFID